MVIREALVLAVLCGAASGLAAQVTLGESVRVRDKWGQYMMTGVVTEVSDGGAPITWRTRDGVDQQVAPGAKIEVLRPKRRWLEGATLGMVAGAILGGAIANEVFVPEYQYAPDLWCFIWGSSCVAHIPHIRLLISGRFPPQRIYAPARKAWRSIPRSSSRRH